MSVDVVTFGCRLNAAESEVIRREAEAAGFSDTVVVNTCAVTAEAVRQARQTIRALRRERPQAKIIVTGCAAQTEPQTFAAMPEVDRVLGNGEKLSASGWAQVRAAFGARRCAEGDRQRHHGGEGDRGASRRQLLPAARALSCRCRTAAITAAPSASFLTAAAIRARCRWAPWSRMCAGSSPTDYREVVLTGVDITSYGADLPGRAEARHAGQADPQARAGAQAAAALLHRFGRGRSRSARCACRATTRLMPHLHLSLQAGDDLILKRMKRRHLRADAIALLRDGAAAPPRHRVRRRPDRGLSDRDRGDVPELAGAGRGLRADASACLSVLAAPRHAGRPHAAALPRQVVKERARAAARAAAPWRSRAISTAKSARRAASCRSTRYRPHRAFHPGEARGAGRGRRHYRPENGRA